MEDLLPQSTVSRQLGQQQGFLEHPKRTRQVARLHKVWATANFGFDEFFSAQADGEPTSEESSWTVRSIPGVSAGDYQIFLVCQDRRWLLEKPCSALDCEGATFANAWADSSCVDETSSFSMDFFRMGKRSSSGDDVSWASLGSKGVTQASMTCLQKRLLRKLGRRRARWGGSRSTQSTLPSVEEEDACDAFSPKLGSTLNSTSTLHALSRCSFNSTSGQEHGVDGLWREPTSYQKSLVGRSAAGVG
eukprot:3271176-Amphidinium_carterae.1